MERDAESGMDLMGARYYNSNMGRFSSPDPSGLAYADPTNPQSLNLYSYALNNPLRFIDPSGLTPCDYGSSDQGGEDWENADNDGECIANGGTPNDYSETVNVNPDNSGDDTLSTVSSNSSSVIQYQQFDAPGLTKKQLACAADATFNGALSIIVPGYAAGKAIASFEGFSLNPFGYLAGTSGLFSGGDPTLLQTAAGVAGANEVYSSASYVAAGGASALGRVQALTSRAGFGLQTASRQTRLLSQLGSLESLEGAASFASKANNITSAISAGYDIYKCVTTP